MGVTVAVTRVACNTSTGTQDITTSDLGGLTPKAAMVFLSTAVTDGTAADDRVFMWGITDGTNEYNMSHFSDHGVTTSDSEWDNNGPTFIYIQNAVGVQDGSAAFSAWITNGIRINWTDAPAAAYLLTVVLFAGTDLSVDVDSIGMGNVVDTATDITAPGFTPDVIFCFIQGSHNSNPRGFGMAHFDGVSTITQRCVTVNDRDNRTTTQQYLIIQTDRVVEQRLGAFGLDYYVVLSDFDANGFTVTNRSDGANNDSFTYLALNFGGAVSSWVGTHNTGTSTGNVSDTGPGFTPQFVFQMLSLAEATATQYTANRAGSIGFSAIDANNEYTTIVSSEDAVTTTNTQSLSDDRAIVVPDDDGTLDIEATFVSFDANGWTVNYSNAPATAKLFFALAIEAEAGAAAPFPHRPRPNPVYRM